MPTEKPTPPSILDTAVVATLNGCSPEELDAVAEYALALAEHTRRTPVTDHDDSVSEEELEAIKEEYSIDPSDYDDVPTSGAYITTKTTKQTEKKSYRYLYFQWRDGDSWKNEYIGPVPGGN